MQGSLAEPPIILHSSRWKALLGVAFSLLLGIISILAIADIRSDGTPAIDIWALYGVAATCALAAPTLLVQATIRPNTMTISPAGVNIRGMFRLHIYRWDELSKHRNNAL